MTATKKLLLFLAAVFLIVVGVILKLVLSGREKVTILCPPDAAELFRELADSYQSENEVQIDIEELDAATYGDSVVERLSEKHPADLVVFTQSTEPPSDAAFACLRDLSTLPELSDTTLKLEEGEKLPVLPLCGDVPVVFYNRDLFASDQLVPPETGNSFALLCMHFQNRDRCALGIALEQGMKRPDLSLLADSFLVNTGGVSAYSLLSFFRSLENTGVFTQEYAADRDRLLSAFQNGDCAMMMGQWSDFPRFEQLNLTFEYGAFLLPGDSPATSGVLIPSVSVSVSTGAGEAAKRFVSYLLSEAGQELICSKCGALSVRKTSPSGGAEAQYIYQNILAIGVKPSVLSALPKEKRSFVLAELCRVADKEFVDPAQLQSILSLNRNLKGDKP